jgi:uncharacterized membrane protein YphA (DoxX/SURF4 family)
VLVFAGAIKLFDLRQSVIAVQAYQFPIPETWETILGYGLPVVEVLLGLAILAGLFTRWTALLAGLALVAYIAAISSAWARGLNIDCGCLTPGGILLTKDAKLGYALDIARDLGLLIIAAWLVRFQAPRWSLDAWLVAATTDGTASGLTDSTAEDTTIEMTTDLSNKKD